MHDPISVAGHGHALFTDLYELTMLQAYVEERMTDVGAFDFYIRELPPGRNYFVACGLETVLTALENLRFSDEDLSFLASLDRFSDKFLAWLADFRFTGDVYAMLEGTLAFPNEPLLEVVAPLPEAQLVETLVLNQIHFQTAVASKASRVVTAARGRTVVDFGARRAHGYDAAIKCARAMYIAGYDSTSMVEAGRQYGIPVVGTVAHSYIEAHDSEADAFRRFVKLYPDTVLLVDTYDTLSGIDRVIELARELGEAFKVRAVRLDSGDLTQLARESRRRLDRAGLTHVGIIASGGLDEYAIESILKAEAPINGFGVGTRVNTVADAPNLEAAYKLVSYAGQDRGKLSTGKVTYPGRKQVFRRTSDGLFQGDIVVRSGEQPAGEALLHHVMAHGRRLRLDPKPLDSARNRLQEQLAQLPPELKALAPPERPYPVTISESLRRARRRIEILYQGVDSPASA